MAIEPYSTSQLIELAPRTPETDPRRDSSVTNPADKDQTLNTERQTSTSDRLRSSTDTITERSNDAPQPETLTSPVADRSQTQGSRTFTSGLTPPPQLAQAVDRLGQTLQQQSQQQLETGYRNPGTYFSVLV